MIRLLTFRLALALAFAGSLLACSSSGADAPETTQEEDPNPAPNPPPPPPPPPTPPPPSGGPSLDPGFAEPANRIDLHYNDTLTAAQNGDALETALESLGAGDDLVIHAGTYLVDSRISIDARGSETETIRFGAAEGEAVRIEQTNFGQNGVEFDHAYWLTVRGIEFVGGDICIRLTDVHHLYFVNNEVHDCADAAITANSADTSYLYFVDNHIHDTDGHGEGFYLGANYAASITHHTYVVGNHIHDTALGPNGLQGDGVEIKDGSYACVISDNLIERTNYPGILVYGTGGQAERNVIERNVIIASREGGIQVAADAIVRNNLIIGALDACIVSHSHQDASPANLEIVHNTLVNTGVCIRTYDWTGTGIVLANNALYSDEGSETAGAGLGTATVSSNISLANLTAFVDVTLDGVSRDATPAPVSVLIEAADLAHAVADDLTGEARDTTLDAGARDHKSLP